MRKFLLLLSVFLFPFQTFSFKLEGSRYDISAFILLSIALINFGIYRKIERVNSYFLILFVLIQLIVFLIYQVPLPSRFISGIIWLGGLILTVLVSTQSKYDPYPVSRMIGFTNFLSSGLLFFQYYFLGESRPQAWFDEPSFAGLSFYSFAIGLLSILLKFKLNLRYKLLAIVCFLTTLYAAYLTKSLHFFTFILTSFILIVIHYSSSFIKLISSKKSILLLVLIYILYFSLSSVIQTEHFSSRTDFENPNNISLLSWLRGFDQMLGSIKISPLFGLGLGSTGLFTFDSDYSLELRKHGLSSLNLMDAYSLGFRLIIEVGPVFFSLFIMYFLKKIIAFRRYYLYLDSLSTRKNIAIVFNFMFSVSLIIGCLIKEPLYAQSFLYLGIFIFSSTKFSSPRLPVKRFSI